MTPALLRYKQLKEQNPNTVLLYRMGDFYEAFWEDAVTISKVLDIALTSRDRTEKKTPMAGIPYHALDAYLGKLIDAGYKVAVAEQEEEKVKDEKSGKMKVVIHRNISRIVTPSTYDRETDYKSHFLVSIVIDDIKKLIASINPETNISGHKPEIALACIDPNGSTFWTTVFDSLTDLDNELFRLNPSEILFQSDNIDNLLVSRFVSKNTHIITPIEKKNFLQSENLLNHLKITSFKALGLENETEIRAATACFYYISDTQHAKLEHIKNIERKNFSSRMSIDSNTLRNLEIVLSSSPGGITLLQILDHTHTRAGKRLLREWITAPLADLNKIQKRIDAIKVLNFNDNTTNTNLLDSIYDLERVCARISYNTVSPRDLVSLSRSIESANDIKIEISNGKIESENLKTIQENIKNSVKYLEILQNKIKETLIDPAPANIKDGHFINEGVSKELDELRQITSDSKKWLRNLEIMEQQKTGINTLKVKYNRVFGYFLEVSKSQIGKVPESYIRKQTTVNGERYITAELKEKESMILGANDKILEIEQEIYNNLIEESKNYLKEIINLQNSLSELDVYISLSTASQINNYCEPIFNKDNELHIIDGRHPVIEQIVKEVYVYNDVHLKNGEMVLITGPNMGGKSTYIRMTALIAYMAHIGCFVPAKECSLGIIDSIFTRVGASDDLARGESTFMVEMTEAANILRNATEKSLIILDEIGRGTSTYDGMSIAWAIVYYIHEAIKAKTLFATHYHELTVLENELARMSNYTVGISEENGNVVFLRKIEKGKAEKSFGIHVAKLAGLPTQVLDKANAILHELEHKQINKEVHQMGLWEFIEESPKKSKPSGIDQKAESELSTKDKNILEKIKSTDINNLTPMQAMVLLNELKNLSSGQ